MFFSWSGSPTCWDTLESGVAMFFNVLHTFKCLGIVSSFTCSCRGSVILLKYSNGLKTLHSRANRNDQLICKLKYSISEALTHWWAGLFANFWLVSSCNWLPAVTVVVPTHRKPLYTVAVSKFEWRVGNWLGWKLKLQERIKTHWTFVTHATVSTIVG